MLKANDLLKQGRDEELWQMCCGYLYLNLDQFMEIQKKLLLNQLEVLNGSPLGRKIMRGVRPKTVEGFRNLVPLTTYQDYCPELLEKREDILPARTRIWAHSSGRTGDFPCKWVPLSSAYVEQLSKILFGIGILSCCKDWGHIPPIPDTLKLLYSVAPKPYISGTFADVLQMQVPLKYLPDLETAEKLSYEERISAGFKQALDEGLDYFFGLSLVLVKVGEKLAESSSKVNIRQFLTQPRALWHLTRGLIKSRLARRSLLPKDIWSLKGIISSGVDSGVYQQKIRDFWGKTPLDIYSCTEGGVIATQTWDYDGMTFIPNLNFLEFIPEEENLKWQMDHSYKMKTLLLDEVKPGKNYEIVITSFHGGSLVRYRIGDMVKITSLRNDKLGINIPQMVFEQRVDDVIDFVFVRVTEKTLWQAIEKTGVPYNDWVAYKNAGEATLNLLIELKNGSSANSTELSQFIYGELTKTDDKARSLIPGEYANIMDFKVNVAFLPEGIFDKYTARRQAEGADLAHLKPPHINPSDKVMSALLGEIEDIIVIRKIRATAHETPDSSKIAANS